MKKFIILVSMLVLPAHAGIYKWIDENGDVHFGDQPADMESATELNIRTNNQTGITNSSGNKKERDYLLKRIEKDREADTEKRKEKAEKAKRYSELCKRYKSRLQVHIQSNRTFTMDPSGERTYYSDKQRAERKKKIEKGVAKYCR